MARPPSPLAALRRLFANSDRPIYALDEKQRIVFANEAMAQWTNVPLAALMGMPCLHAGVEDEHGAVAAALAPSPEVLLEGSHRVTLQTPDAGSHTSWRRRRATVLSWQKAHEMDAVFFMLDDADCGDEPETPETRAEQLRQLVVRLRHSLPAHATFHLLGDSALMHRVRQQVEAAGLTQASVLVAGPLGTGREEVAHTVYYGGQSTKGLVPFSCELLDAELLTSALEDLQRSHLELIEGPDAILLLDVDQLPRDSQGPVYQRLRELTPAPRILATTTRDLADIDFHQDFAAFLSEMIVQLPPLTARREDIPPLAQFVLQEANATRASQLLNYTSEAMDLIVAYPWFENHDELKRLLSEACEAASGTTVVAKDLPHPFHAAHQQAAHPVREEDPIDLPLFLEKIEREMIQRALKLAKGNKAQAARLLSLRRSRLLRRLEALGLSSEASTGEDE